MAEGDVEDPFDYGTIVRNNLMKRPGYAPYCGLATCMARLVWNGSQFNCGVHRSYTTQFPDDFIEIYKNRWHCEGIEEGNTMNFDREGYYWAKLITPTEMPKTETWVSGDWEVVFVADNNGEGDEQWSVWVPGIPPTQWPKNFEWGPEVPQYVEPKEGDAA